MEQITVNGRVFAVQKLLGHGKGGYSYLAGDESGRYVVKQIHHEPCNYYQFGDKLAAERADYARLKAAGAPLPKLLDVDEANERLLKEYIDGPTAAALVERNALPPQGWRQVCELAQRLREQGLNIDWYPTNFIWQNDRFYYVDYECNPYDPQWSLETWGAQYWGKQP